MHLTGKHTGNPSSTSHLCCSNCPPQAGPPLSGVQPALLFADQRLVTLLNDLLTFRQDHLDVAWVAHVRVDSAMSSVRATSLFWRLVDLDVLNDQVSSVKALDIGVGFGVLKESEEEFGGLDWPSCSSNTELFAYKTVLA